MKAVEEEPKRSPEREVVCVLAEAEVDEDVADDSQSESASVLGDESDAATPEWRDGDTEDRRRGKGGGSGFVRKNVSFVDDFGEDDTETLGLALSVAEDILAPSNRDYRGCKSALRTWRADASALTKPPFGDDPPGLKTRPRWLLGEYTFLRFLWRASQAA